MENEIKDYSLAVQEHVEALRDETKASIRVKLARNKLHIAKQAMMSKEHELTQI